MPDVFQLRDAKLSAYTDAVTAWTLYAQSLDEVVSSAAVEVGGMLRSSHWTGKDADATYRRLNAEEDSVRVAAQEARLILSVIDEAELILRDCQNRLIITLDSIPKTFTVESNGTVTAPWAQPPQDMEGAHRADREAQAEAIAADKSEAERFTAGLRAIVKEATDADFRLSGMLGRLDAGSAGTGPEAWKDVAADRKMLAGIDGVNPDNIPQDPTAAAKWWDGLSESDKQMYLAQHPEKIGATDGLPATTRDQANRVLLSEEIPRLRDDPDEEDRLAALEKLQGALDYQADGNQALPPSYLLGYSNEGDGRAIVAVGNPDTAKNTAVMVPGMATTLDGLPKDLARGNNLLMASDQNSTPGSTSVITWYGYDSPDGGGAMTDKSAEEGAPDLRRFTDGLGAARGPADSGDGHTTLIGHSYGTVVIGEAAKDDKIPGVDDIVVAGSPGMHASHAEDLGVGENHVWVAEGLTDPIPELGRSAHGERSWESPLRPVVPTDSAFGGRHFSAWDSAGHGEYWEQDKESLDNQANIVTGNYDEVK